jgi:hypothetical protein
VSVFFAVVWFAWVQAVLFAGTRAMLTRERMGSMP